MARLLNVYHKLLSSPLLALIFILVQAGVPKGG